MKVLLIGGTGRLSRDTTELCIANGYDVYLVNRGHKNDFRADNVHYIIADINNQVSVAEALKNQTFDVVVDYLTYRLDTLTTRLELFRNRIKQYIFISSATVYPIQDRTITETCTIGNDGWTYAKQKRLCEEYLREHEEELTFQYTIIRPYVTYDRKRIPFPIISKVSNWNLLYRIANGYPILMPGNGEQRVTLTSTKDFAVGIVGLLMNEAAYQEDFNITGDVVATWNDVVRIIEREIDRKADVVYVNTDALANVICTFSEELRFDKAYSHVFDNSKIKRAVPAFRSTVSLEEGLKQTVVYLTEHRETQVIDEPWNAMEDVLCNRFSSRKRHISLRKRWLYFRSQNCYMLALKRRMK